MTFACFIESVNKSFHTSLIFGIPYIPEFHGKEKHKHESNPNVKNVKKKIDWRTLRYLSGLKY